MRHPHCRTLERHWRNAREQRPLTAVAADEPARAAIFANAFMLRRMDKDHHVYVLVGPDIAARHRRELLDQNFLALWSGNDRDLMRTLIEGALECGQPASALARGKTLNGGETDFELVLAPLANAAGVCDRVLGLMQPLENAAPGAPIITHRLVELSPAASNKRQRAPRVAGLALELLANAL